MIYNDEYTVDIRSSLGFFVFVSVCALVNQSVVGGELVGSRETFNTSSPPFDLKSTQRPFCRTTDRAETSDSMKQASRRWHLEGTRDDDREAGFEKTGRKSKEGRIA